MGFIERTAGIPASTKCVYSAWFMVPAETLTAVAAQEEPDIEDRASDGFNSNCFYPALDRVIPLWLFGSQEVGTEDASGDAAGNPISPSYIGIDCVSGVDDATVVVNLQMSNFAIGDLVEGSVYRPACFYMGGYGDSAADSPLVVGGQKHHILISWDLSASCSNLRVLDGESVVDSFTPGPTFSWALDGVHKVGPAMFPSGDRAGGIDGVSIVPQALLWSMEGAEGSEVTWSSAALELDNPMGFPAFNDYVAKVFNLRMSEVQIFTDVSVDCRDSEVIEAFRRTNGRPAHPSLAAALCGKDPEIYFRTHEDWITGNNRGTAGDFTPTGTILESTEP
jgi:hypothetical protein